MRLDNRIIWVASDTWQVDNSNFNKTELTNSSRHTNPSFPTGHIGVPFMTSYPIITYRGREGVPIKHGEGFFVKYIIKMEPYTRSAFKFVIDPDANTKACAIVITHIGDNFPCTEPPGPEAFAFTASLLVASYRKVHLKGLTRRLNDLRSAGGDTGQGPRPLRADLRDPQAASTTQSHFEESLGMEY